MLMVTSDNFTKEVMEADVPVLIDFFATWCMPCKMFAPVVEAVAEELEGKVKVVKVDVDEAPDLARKYAVMSIPTIKLVKGDAVLGSYVGAMSQDELEDWVGECYGK